MNELFLEQWPLILVFKERWVERKYLKFLYGEKRNYWYSFFSFSGSLSFFILAFTMDFKYLVWCINDVISACLLLVISILYCNRCYVGNKFVLELSMVISNLFISIRTVLRDCFVEEMNFNILKMGSVVFDLVMFLIVRPRVVVFLPIFVVATTTYTIFIPIFFWDKVNDQRWIASIIVYILCETLILVFLNVFAQANRKCFARGLTLAEREKRLLYEHEKSVELLKNILPAKFIGSIFDGSLRDRGFILQTIENGTILQSDIINFTGLCSSVSSRDIIFLLDRHFSVSDEVVRELNLEKLKTIGDAYISIGGLNSSPENFDDSTDHFPKMVLLGLALIESLDRLNRKYKWKEKVEISILRKYKDNEGMEKERDRNLRIFSDGVKIRVGVACGVMTPVVFGRGVHISFDVFGSCVSEVSTLEESSYPCGVHVSQGVYELTKNEFEYSPYEPFVSCCENPQEINSSGQLEESHNSENCSDSIEDDDKEEGEDEYEEIKKVEETESFIIKFLPRLKSIRNKILRHKLSNIIDEAVSNREYIEKRENLITTSTMTRTTSKKEKKRNRKVPNEFDDAVDSTEENDWSDAKKRPLEEIHILGNSGDLLDEDYKVFSSSGDLLENTGRSASTSNKEVCGYSFERIFVSEHAKKEQEKQRLPYFLRCLAWIGWKVLWANPCCGPCLAILASLGKGMTRACLYCLCLKKPYSPGGWIYCLCIFANPCREKEYLMDLFRRDKFTYFFIFLFSLIQRLCIFVYFLSSQQIELFYESYIVYSLYTAIIVEVISILFLLVTELPIVISIKQKRNQKLLATPDLPKNILKILSTSMDKKKKKKKKKKKEGRRRRRRIPRESSRVADSYRKQNSNNEKTDYSFSITQTYHKKVKLFDHLLYRPIFVFPMVFLNFSFFPVDLVLLSLGKTRAWMDLFLFMNLFSLVFINWFQGLHFCLKSTASFFLVVVHIIHILVNYENIDDEYVSKFDYASQDVLLVVEVFIIFFVWSLLRETVQRSSFDKAKRIEEENRRLLVKKWKNEMIIHSVLPRDVLAEIEKMSHLKKKSSLGVLGASNIECMCLCFIKVTNVTQAIKHSSGSRNMNEEEIVSFLVSLFHEFDESMREWACQKIKSIQECYMFISRPSIQFSSGTLHQKQYLYRRSNSDTLYLDLARSEDRMPGETDRQSSKLVRNALNASVGCLQKLKMVTMKSKLFSSSISSVVPNGSTKVALKLGIHSGVVSAGVVGNTKFLWDIFGDAVNLAARLTATSEDNRIHVTKDMAERYNIQVDNTKLTALKGKGDVETGFVVVDQDIGAAGVEVYTSPHSQRRHMLVDSLGDKKFAEDEEDDDRGLLEELGDSMVQLGQFGMDKDCVLNEVKIGRHVIFQGESWK